MSRGRVWYVTWYGGMSRGRGVCHVVGGGMLRGRGGVCHVVGGYVTW